MFVQAIHPCSLHNTQHAFVLFCYVEKLVRSLFDLGVGLLCLGLKLEVCHTFVLLYCAFVLVYYLHMHCAYCWCSYSLLGLDQ
jgi:hypothetical protein